MIEDSDFDEMADACIAAAERIMQVGSPELQAVMRIVLAILGRDAAQRALVPSGGDRRTNGADSTG